MSHFLRPLLARHPVAQVLINTAGVESPPAFDETLQASQLFDDFTTRSMSQVAESYLLPSGLQ